MNLLPHTHCLAFHERLWGSAISYTANVLDRVQERKGPHYAIAKWDR
jgi:hypothetical protein